MVLWSSTLVADDRHQGGLPVCLIDDFSAQEGSTEQLGPPQEPDVRLIEHVSPADLAELMQGRLLVDLRPREHAFQHPVDGAMKLDLSGLRTMLRATRREVLVFGAGDDDLRLSARLATWKQDDRLKLVGGGAPGILLHANQPVEDAVLLDMLSITPARALAAANNGDLDAILGDPLNPQRSDWYRAASDADGASGPDSLGRAGLLIDQDEDQARTRALTLSRERRTPVFYVPGGKSSIEEFVFRQAAMNRDPQLIGARCF